MTKIVLPDSNPALDPRVTWVARNGALCVYVDGREVDALTGPRLALHLTEVAKAYREPAAAKEPTL